MFRSSVLGADWLGYRRRSNDEFAFGKDDGFQFGLNNSNMLDNAQGAS